MSNKIPTTKSSRILLETPSSPYTGWELKHRVFVQTHKHNPNKCELAERVSRQDTVPYRII